MTQFRFNLLFAGLCMFAAGQAVSRAAATNDAPDFKEVYDLVRAHLSGVNDAELNRIAVESLVAGLRPKVSLVEEGKTTASAEGPPVSKADIYENNIAYIRIVNVGGSLPKDVADAYQRLSSTNKLKGIVLDLRYSDGADYDAAAATADLFISKAQPLFNKGNGMVSSHEKNDAIKLPLALLVNQETARAAEVLAAILRETGTGLILGGKTAGEAAIAEVFPLKNGEHLRIATSPITLADGSKLSADGVTPDITVPVSNADERAYYADAFLVLPRTNAIAGADGNRNGAAAPSSRSARFNEADLVREHRAGIDSDRISPADIGMVARPAKPEAPVVSDPALARALDLLKGLAVVSQDRF